MDISVKELVSMVERGDLQLPEMQRGYVWRATRVRDLFDSLYRNYPSGSILVWDTDKEQPTKKLAVPQNHTPFSTNKLLLDGQQRITSLSAVLRGEPVTVRGRRRPIDLLFNLDHPDQLVDYSEVDDDSSGSGKEDELDDTEFENEENQTSLYERIRQMTFVISSKSLARQSNWVSVTQVFKDNNDKTILQQAGVKDFNDPKYEKYVSRLTKLRSIKDYVYTMHVLNKDLSYEEVAEIFVRVNSLGAKLRGSDLALAQLTARWRNLLTLMEEFQTECEENWITLDLGLLVRAMVVFATDQAKFDRVASIPIESFKRGWEEAKNGLRFAINFLKNNAHIEDESLLTSPFFFIVLAYFSRVKKEKLTHNDENKLLFWIYVASARGRYSKGSSETILNEDLNIIKRGEGPLGLIEKLKQQFGRLDFDIPDFIGRGINSSLFSLVYLTLKDKGAKDWSTRLEISLSHQGRNHYIQYHHIFPKSLLKTKYEKSEINEISNMAFISGDTNRRISNRKPNEYLKELLKNGGKELLQTQFVPTEESLFEIERYREFLEKRRTLICDAVNEFIKKFI